RKSLTFEKWEIVVSAGAASDGRAKLNARTRQTILIHHSLAAIFAGSLSESKSRQRVRGRQRLSFALDPPRRAPWVVTKDHRRTAPSRSRFCNPLLPKRERPGCGLWGTRRARAPACGSAGTAGRTTEERQGLHPETWPELRKNEPD